MPGSMRLRLRPVAPPDRPRGLQVQAASSSEPEARSSRSASQASRVTRTSGVLRAVVTYDSSQRASGTRGRLVNHLHRASRLRATPGCGADRPECARGENYSPQKTIYKSLGDAKIQLPRA